MKVLSLFDGISCARVALERAGFEVEKYYASETDKYAIQIAQKNYPDTIQLGDVKNITKEMVGEVDLIIGGSPCQDLSVAKNNRKGLQGERSSLFYEFVRLVKEVHPKWWILENVNSMSEASKTTITKVLGENLNMSMYWTPKMIDAALVSAQSRKRLFWTNIPSIKQPKDKEIILQDILEADEAVTEKSYTIPSTYYKENVKSLLQRKKKGLYVVRVGKLNEKAGQGDRVYSTIGKSCTLSANGGGRGAKTGLYETKPKQARKLTAIECERLQCLPDHYTEGVSNTQRLKTLGNAFNVDVVAHILSHLQEQIKDNK